MPSHDRGYGPTPEEFTRYTNLVVGIIENDGSVTTTSADLDEFYRQRARAQELVDAVVGGAARFHDQLQIGLSSVTSTTFTSSALASSQDDYFNHLEVRIVQGNGSGFQGWIADYDGASGEATVSGVTTDVDFGDADSDSVVLLTQVASFPRATDMDVTGRPRLPEALTRVVAYTLEYLVSLDSIQGANARAFVSQRGDVVQEGLADWQTTYANNQDPGVRLIGSKAYQEALGHGLINRRARLVRSSDRGFGSAIKVLDR